ncbi:MAG: MBOAT family protein [Ancalomicrobiaceae bacterium]|nr:MBOAT family protein [Ancalomicrobiaceae bacterium]
MLFPTIDFALFFALVFPVTWALNRVNSVKKLFLVAASYLFYASWNWHFCLLLLVSSTLAFAAGLLIDLSGGRLKRLVLWGAIAADLAVLGYFKYINFLSAEVANVSGLIGTPIDLGTYEMALPVAISFITFHAISYVVDVYDGRVKATRSYDDLLLYIAFFPHLVAGPIVRAELFLPQLAGPSDSRSIRLGDSMRLILGGLFKKVVLASHLATLFVDPLYVTPASQTSFDLWIGLYAYALVIYCDFSAYTDIAIGIANLLGYRFPQNFDQPYRALSVAEFWRRWHMTLSNWLRQYVYIPLGGNRHGSLMTARNLLITMLLGGLWHGAGLQFIVWGGLHGIALVATRLLAPIAEPFARRFPTGFKVAAWVLTFHFVCVAWVFFRAGTLDDALAYLTTLVSMTGGASTLTPFVALVLAAAALTHLVPAHLYVALGAAYERLGWTGKILVPAAVIYGVVLVAPLGVPPFIYFQF